jgi:hypothetical protein
MLWHGERLWILTGQTGSARLTRAEAGPLLRSFIKVLAQMDFSDFAAQMLDPAQVLTHLPYALLVISMMMNDMGWLRAIAICAGVTRIINRAFIQVDSIIVFREIIFVAVNVIQLAILWWYAKRHRFTGDEERFASIMPASIERRTVRRLLRLARLRHVDAGQRLTGEGEAVHELIFIAEGVAQVERGGRIVGVCGPGDFLGEMSFVSGGAASATTVAAGRCATSPSIRSACAPPWPMTVNCARHSTPASTPISWASWQKPRSGRLNRLRSNDLGPS